MDESTPNICKMIFTVHHKPTVTINQNPLTYFPINMIFISTSQFLIGNQKYYCMISYNEMSNIKNRGNSLSKNNDYAYLK